MGAKAVFLDRDGTVNIEEDFLSDPDKIRLEGGAAEGLRALGRQGFVLVIVSNQSGVARGLFDEEAVARVNARLDELLRAEGIEIKSYHYCPHHPGGSVERYTRDCRCRKPGPGMFEEAAERWGIDFGNSYTVGDRARDLEAGKRVGTRGVLVRTGYGVHSVDEALEMKVAEYVAEDLRDAAEWIMEDEWRRSAVDDG